MRKAPLVLAAAATLGLATIAAPAPAQAWRGGFFPGVAGGLIAGAVIGGIASSAYAYGPGYGYYDGYAPGYGYGGGYAPAYYGGYYGGGYGGGYFTRRLTMAADTGPTTAGRMSAAYIVRRTPTIRVAVLRRLLSALVILAK